MQLIRRIAELFYFYAVICYNKISCLLLAAMLFYLSVSANHGYFIPDNNPCTGNTNDTPANWFADTPAILNLTDPAKNAVSSFRDLNSLNLKISKIETRTSQKPAEIIAAKASTLFVIVTGYLYPRFEIRTILFPFHFFL